MCDDIMQEVSGLQPDRNRGILSGYRRFCLKGEDYPAVVPDAAGRVDGVIYSNLTGMAWDRLDRFEGEMYDRRIVEVRTDDDRLLEAATYVLKAQYHDHLDPVEWDFRVFLKRGKARFLKQYSGYRAL